MDLSKSKILVTGADGFIGSHLVETLVRDGHDVRAFVYYNSFDSWGWLGNVASDVAGKFAVFPGDIRDQQRLREASDGCNVVLHLAALIAIPYSYHAPESYIETNIRGTLNVLQAARDLTVDKVIVASTSEVYGTARSVPITEDHPLSAQSPYAATKIAADQLALSFHQSFGMPVGILRPFNTYGPRQSARAVISTIIAQINAGERQIKLGALHPTRDFTFVTDTARGFMQAAASDAAVGRVTHIGSGFEISIGDTVALISEVMGVDVEVIQDDCRLRPASSEVERLFAATDDARELFDWNPEYGGREGFARGLQVTAEWFSNPETAAWYKPDQYTI